MQYVVAYDITDNASRSAVADYLLSCGLIRIQKSVFVGDLSRSELKEVKLTLAQMTIDTIATIHVFSQCKQCSGRQLKVQVSNSVIPEISEGGEEMEMTTRSESSAEEIADEVKPKLPFNRELVVITPENASEDYINQEFNPVSITLKKNPRKSRKGANSTKVLDLSKGPEEIDLS